MIRSAAKLFCVPLIACFLASATTVLAQGPRPEYFFNPATELTWANCELYLDGGSRQKIPFTPFISSLSSPYGTEQYKKDVHINAPIVFAGNGIVAPNHDSYKSLDVKNKVIMFFYDFPDTINHPLGQSHDLKSLISTAVRKQPSAIVLASYQNSAPFLAIRDTLLAMDKEVPIIAINKESAMNILVSAGKNTKYIFGEWGKGNIPKSEQLITKMRLNIKGKFEDVESEFFTLKYRKEVVSKSWMDSLLSINDRSVEFILNLFAEIKPKWKKSLTVYFADYDLKLFFTRHWGYGWSNANGAFIVLDKDIPGFGLAVHENTHSLFRQNWGGNNSFLVEGLGKYAEAMATDEDTNHRITVNFLKEDRLYRLTEMQKFNIGRVETETEVGYPASGSLVQYIIQQYGLKKFLEKWEVADQWEEVYNKSLVEIEKNWLEWLAKNYDVDSDHVRKHMSK